MGVETRLRGSEGGVVWDLVEWSERGDSGAGKGRGCDGMSRVGAYGAEIHIGEPIQYESERSTLKEIERLLVADKRRAVVFANFTVDSRQIDLVIVLESLVPVIEAKGRTRPVRGRANGPWQVQLASGEWKNFPNPYVQTRDTAFAFKDAMEAFCECGVSYVSAALVFAPGIPRGLECISGEPHGIGDRP